MKPLIALFVGLGVSVAIQLIGGWIGLDLTHLAGVMAGVSIATIMFAG